MTLRNTPYDMNGCSCAILLQQQDAGSFRIAQVFLHNHCFLNPSDYFSRCQLVFRKFVIAML